MSKLISIHPDDNVLIVARPVMPGDVEQIDGVRVTFESPLDAGHKIAARAIGEGEKVIKFGVPIGSATRDICRGEHIHLHNLKSDFIDTYTLDHEFRGR